MTTIGTPATAWGQCLAFGCPLPGSIGRAGEWACCCHCHAEARHFQPITAMLRRSKAITDAVLTIRHYHGSAGWQQAYRMTCAQLVEAKRCDLLPGEADWSPYRPNRRIVGQWLARLENQLIREADEIARAAREVSPPPSPVPVAPVIGPSHALAHYSEPARGEPDES